MQDHAPALVQHRPGTALVTVMTQWTAADATVLQAATRMSQEAFAGYLGVNPRTVAKWRQRPDVELRADTCELLDTALKQLDDLTRERFSVMRAETSPAAAAIPVPATPVGPDWLVAAAMDSSADALSRSGQIGSDVLPDLVQHVMQVSRGYDFDSRTEAFRHARVTREIASQLANRTQRPSELADLYVILGQLNALMGSLAFDLGSWGAAEQLARAATQYADLAGHRSLQAWTLGLEATLAFWAEDGDRALDRLELAFTVAPAGAPRFRLLNIAARAHAVNGNIKGTRKALRKATAERETADAKHDELHDTIGGEFGFGDARAAACAGAAWLRVGSGVEALDQTQRSLALHFSGVAPGPPGVVHGASVDAAAAYLLQGDLSGAENFLRPVLQLHPDPANASIAGRLTNISSLLNRASDPAAEGLRADVSAWLADTSVQSTP